MSAVYCILKWTPYYFCRGWKYYGRCTPSGAVWSGSILFAIISVDEQADDSCHTMCIGNRMYASRYTFSSYGKHSKISNTSCAPKKLRQTAQTQIRLLLKTTSEEAVWTGFALFAIQTSILWILALVTIFFKSEKVFEILEQLPYTVKPVLSGHSKITPKLVFKVDYRLMQVISIAECSKGASKGSILQYFRLSLSFYFP